MYHDDGNGSSRGHHLIIYVLQQGQSALEAGDEGGGILLHPERRCLAEPPLVVAQPPRVATVSCHQ